MSEEQPPSRLLSVLPEIQEFLSTVDRLVGPGGCAWHAEQTHDSLVRYLFEESAELAEAIEMHQAPESVNSELGDVLYQVLFHSAIAARDHEGYDLATVANSLNQKLIRRHPHVFGDRGPLSVEQLNAEWEQLKEQANGQDRGSRGTLEGIPQSMPGLARATKIIDRLSRAHHPQAADALAAVSSRARPAQPGLTEEELGQELLALLIQAQEHGQDADRALRNALRALEYPAEVKE